MKLVYWLARCKDDHASYSIRAKTRKECKRLREESGEESYGPVERIEIEYADGFDLLRRALGEGGVE